MTPQDVKGFFEALGSGGFDAIEARLAEDVVLEFPGRRFGARVEGRRRVLVFLKRNQRMFEGGLRFDVRWAGTVDGRAIAQWTNAGRTRDGQDYVNRGCTVFRVEDGLVVEIQDYLDTETLAETWPRGRDG